MLPIVGPAVNFNLQKKFDQPFGVGQGCYLSLAFDRDVSIPLNFVVAVSVSVWRNAFAATAISPSTATPHDRARGLVSAYFFAAVDFCVLTLTFAAGPGAFIY